MKRNALSILVISILTTVCLFYNGVNIRLLSTYLPIVYDTDTCINTIANTMTVDIKGCVPAVVCNDVSIPIFVFTRDRITSLQEALESYKNFTSSYEIIILDHFSTYPPMLTYLTELNSTIGVQVHALKKPNWFHALQESADIIEEYLVANSDVQFYVFTDSDISMFRSAPDTLLYFAGVLNSCKQINVIGPQLQISDIPDSYSDKAKVMHGHGVRQHFWHTVPNMATWNRVGYNLAIHPIDTTFAMRRRGYRFGRLQMPAIRAYAPYSAVHIDWYYNSSSLPADKIWYLNHSQQGVNNWRTL